MNKLIFSKIAACISNALVIALLIYFNTVNYGEQKELFQTYPFDCDRRPYLFNVASGIQATTIAVSSILLLFNLWIGSIVVAACCLFGLVPYGVFFHFFFKTPNVTIGLWVHWVRWVILSISPVLNALSTWMTSRKKHKRSTFF